MDKLEKYREAIEAILHKYGDDYGKPEDGVETQMMMDKERDHYHLFHTGWHNGLRVYGCFLHLDIKNGKVWLQHNGTEIKIASELVEMGVPKKDIVIGFHSPFKRQYSGFSMG